MAGIGIFIEHRTRPGRRDDVFAIWKQHLAPAISANAAHLDYFYGFADHDPDTLLVFQRYRDRQAAQEFLSNKSYKAYLSDVEPLLEGAPTVRSVQVAWTKSPPL